MKLLFEKDIEILIVALLEYAHEYCCHPILRLN